MHPTPRVAEDAGPAAAAAAVTGAYGALRSGAIVVDRSDRSRWRFTGPRAAETLTGLVTNDVLALMPGEGLYAAALTPKGKIVADLRIFRDDDGLLADTGPAAAEGWRAMARKFVNPRVAPFAEVSERTSDTGVFGSRAAELLSRVFETDANAFHQLQPYSHVRARLRSSSEDVTVVRAAELGEVPGFDIIAPAQITDELRAGLGSIGAVAATRDLFDIARIEAGFPEWGVDMNEDTLPQEANFDDLGAISYSKGCYVGQETVARIHFRGHVNKMLRRVRFNADAVPPRGAALADEAGKSVGAITSAALSPRQGGVGIAMVRREVEAGATLIAQWGSEQTDVSVA